MRWARLHLPLCLLLTACSQRSCANSTSNVPPVASSGRTTGEPALPGLGLGDPELAKRLSAALAAKPDGYQPRTHHKHADGTPKYTNRLIFETSPYLLQHAHNPVNWYAWGEEAFARARRENKPILLSVGYSTCHWCHVMERESFEDVEIASFINRHFVAIKVDREERPDIDDIYMSAVQQLSGRGGWPMTVVLTPERDPFFAGTYLPPRDGARGAKKGFLSILRELSREFSTRRSEVVARAQRLSTTIAEQAQGRPAAGVPDAMAIRQTVRELAGSFDPEWGGFGRAPKFPRPVALELLLRYHRRTGDPQALHIVLHTLTRMAEGGIYDQLGGGFHRYATDRRWLVPHFEKMLYDNAQLVNLYLSAFQLSGNELYRKVVNETLRYVQREMTDSGGAFYSATDADSRTPQGHDEEGYFFTWTPEELEANLDPADARAFALTFDVTPHGNFEGRNILHRPRSTRDLAGELGTSEVALERRMIEARNTLYEVRRKRPAPLLDDKLLSAWNGLTISAFARAALVLDDANYARVASRAASFLLDNLRDKEGRLLRSYRAGRARHVAYLDDYAFVIQGLLDLYEATSETRWLEQALRLQGTLDRFYLDSAGGYFMTSSEAEMLLARAKPSYDGAEPSGNSVALLNLVRLAHITDDDAYRTRAEKGFEVFSQALRHAGRGSPMMLSALEHLLDRALEVIIVKPAGSDARRLLDALSQVYLPNRLLVVTEEGAPLERAARLVPALEGKGVRHGKPTAFVCEHGRCELPTSDPATFKRQLSRATPLFEVRVPEGLPVVRNPRKTH